MPCHDVAGGEQRQRLHDVGGRRDVQCGGAVQRRADDRDGVGEHGQRGQHDQHRDQRRRGEIAHGLDAHRRERVDFLRDVHRTDARGERRTRAAGDDDRRDQRAEFARHRFRDGDDDLRLRAEFRQRRDELDAQHDADGERHHGHDRQRVDADLAHLLEQRARTHRLTAAPAERGEVKTFDEQHRRIADARRRRDGGAADAAQRAA